MKKYGDKKGEFMRLRNVTGSRERILESEFVIKDENAMKGKWHTVFGNKNPIHIEIGMGKGMFILEQARRHPDINYIGIEKYSSVLIRAIDKRAQETEMKNLYFIRMDAEYIENVFEKGEVSYIYLNFSDPWPKDRHAKRRLTSVQFLSRYEKILATGGEVAFKTDNTGLFDFSLEQIESAGWKIINCTRDLHHSEYMADNVMTEYEKKFSAAGNPILRVVFQPKK